MKRILFIILLVSIKQVNAQVCFSSATNYTPFAAPASVITADFNNDGFKDLVVANQSSNNVSVLLGAGTGSFGIVTNFGVGLNSNSQPNNPYAITSADFNNDGFIDLATANSNDSTVSVLLGNGTGGFGSAASILLNVSIPISITSADFNGDGKPDLATANWSGNVSILLGTGSGGFGGVTNFAAGTNPVSIINADFNNDGKIDLALADQTTFNVSVLFGTGTGSFGSATNFAVGNTPMSLIKADFNNDGKTDLATANINSKDVSILLGTGSGSFGTAASIWLFGTQPYSIVSADFNNDDKADLITGSPHDTLSLLLGTGTGSFLSAVNFIIGGNHNSLVSADFNGDSRADLTMTNIYSNSISVLLNAPIHTITIAATATNICPGNSSTLTASGSTSYMWSTGATTASISVSPTVSTVYNVTDGIGCSNTASITVNGFSTPIPEICMVTTDSASNYMYNIIYWDKTLYSQVDSFIIYRYDVTSFSYLRIGAVSKNSLSLFADTDFSIGGPNGGNPLYSSWQYKLAIRDTCGNIGAKSPYHRSMFVQESGATFSWNPYTIETGQSNPVTGYSFLRDDNNTGSWHTLVNTSGSSSTDPNYSSFPNGNWRVDALGFNCTPTFKLSGKNNMNTSFRSHSNTSKPVAIGIEQIKGINNLIILYPNPASNNLNIVSSNELDAISICNSLGEIVMQTKSKPTPKPSREGNVITIDISKLPAGVYTIQSNLSRNKFIKE